MKHFLLISLAVLVIGCKNDATKEPETETISAVVIEPWEQNYQTISQLGDTLVPTPPSEKVLLQYEEKKKAYEAQPQSLDALIWYGRFAAYTGDYRQAIAIYTAGLEQFPNESRILRHRGHRYISVREFDKAIADLERAAQLIEGKENKIEEDGMPNEQNIPVSTQHGNIYYHLGLANYLNRNMPAALAAFKKCLETSHNPDNVVSATHWIYMIQRRMNRPDAAENYLRSIKPDMNVIENHSYYYACQFYKGMLPLEAVYDPAAEDNPSNSAIGYAVGNWYLYNGKPEQANGIFNTLVSGKDWASFGFIAAETDLAKPWIQR